MEAALFSKFMAAANTYHQRRDARGTGNHEINRHQTNSSSTIPSSSSSPFGGGQEYANTRRPNRRQRALRWTVPIAVALIVSSGVYATLQIEHSRLPKLFARSHVQNQGAEARAQLHQLHALAVANIRSLEKRVYPPSRQSDSTGHLAPSNEQPRSPPPPPPPQQQQQQQQQQQHGDAKEEVEDEAWADRVGDIEGTESLLRSEYGLSNSWQNSPSRTIITIPQSDDCVSDYISTAPIDPMSGEQEQQMKEGEELVHTDGASPLNRCFQMNDEVVVHELEKRVEKGEQGEEFVQAIRYKPGRNAKREDIELINNNAADSNHGVLHANVDNDDGELSLSKKKTSDTGKRKHSQQPDRHGSSSHEPKNHGSRQSSPPKAAAAAAAATAATPDSSSPAVFPMCSSKTCLPKLRDYILDKLTERIEFVLRPLMNPHLLLHHLHSTAPQTRQYLMVQQIEQVHKLQTRIVADLRDWVLEKQKDKRNKSVKSTFYSPPPPLLPMSDPAVSRGSQHQVKQDELQIQSLGHGSGRNVEQGISNNNNNNNNRDVKGELDALLREGVLMNLRDLGLDDVNDNGPGLSFQAIEQIHGPHVIRASQIRRSPAHKDASKSPTHSSNESNIRHPSNTTSKMHSASKAGTSGHQHHNSDKKKHLKGKNTNTSVQASKLSASKGSAFISDNDDVSKARKAAASMEDEEIDDDNNNSDNDDDNNPNDDDSKGQQDDGTNGPDHDESASPDGHHSQHGQTQHGEKGEEDDEEEFFLSGDLAIMRQEWTRWIAHWVHHAKLLVIAYSLLPHTVSRMTQVAIQGGNVVALDQRHWAWNLDKALATVLVEAEWLCGGVPSLGNQPSSTLSSDRASVLSSTSASSPIVSSVRKYHAQRCIDSWSSDLEEILQKTVINL
ncbi:hypothetical protein BGW41_001686 [Actinomortierella wolfii]|nr:hypothetical protein BGW41_001686 [Actinomortierella wolfii]